MEAETVLLPRKQEARIRRVEALRHALAGFLLVLASLETLPHGTGEGALASWLGLVAGLVLFIATVRELRAKAEHGEGRFNWVDGFAAAATFAEGYHLHHVGKHYLPYAYTLIAAFYLGLGFLRPRLRGRRRLELDEEGFLLCASLFKTQRTRWAELVALGVEGEAVHWSTADGDTVRVDLAKAKNAAQAQAALLRWATGRVPPPPAPAGVERAVD